MYARDDYVYVAALSVRAGRITVNFEQPENMNGCDPVLPQEKL